MNRFRFEIIVPKWLRRRVCTYVYSVNVGCGPAEERVLLTGLHAVADIYCECCKTTLGWKYVSTKSKEILYVTYLLACCFTYYPQLV